MKKQAKTLALLTVTVLISSYAYAEDGIINFIGGISTTTCKIEGVIPGGAVNKNVPMQDAGAGSLSAPGKVAMNTPFTITLGSTGDAGCTDGVSVKVHYEATSPQINPATGNLMLTAGGAGGVEIQVLDAKYKVLDLRDPSTNTEEVVIVNNTAILRYSSQYVATGPVIAGDAKTSVKYSIVYN